MATKINDFPTNRQQADEKLKKFLPPLYRRLTNKGYYKFFEWDDKQGNIMQTRGVDAEHDSFSNRRREWDEHKLAQWPANNEPLFRICAETWSCTLPGQQTKGWMYTSRADNLFYGFEVLIFPVPLIDMLLLYEFQEFKRLFWQQDLSKYDIDTQKVRNKTRSVLYPIADIVKQFPGTMRVILGEKGCIRVPSFEDNITSIHRQLTKYQLTGDVQEGKEYIASLDKLLTISREVDSNDPAQQREQEQAEIDFSIEQLPIW